MNKVTVKIKSLRITPRKARLILDMIRNKKAIEMLSALKFSNKKVSRDIDKLVKAGLASAKSQDMDENKLYITEARADEGISMKRRFLKSRGRATGYKKSFSKITLTLAESKFKEK